MVDKLKKLILIIDNFIIKRRQRWVKQMDITEQDKTKIEEYLNNRPGITNLLQKLTPTINNHGPWEKEPYIDIWIEQFSDSADYPCLLWKNTFGGFWLGYVGINAAHPLYDKEIYDTIEDIEVHGGVTFSGFLLGGAKGLDAGFDKLFWIGFDCAHADDLMPYLNNPFNFPLESYKDINYAKKETKNLALQLERERIKKPNENINL